MIEKFRYHVEKRLRNKGFTSPESRRILSLQILLTGIASIVGILLVELTFWPLAFGLGAALATASLWANAKAAMLVTTRTVNSGAVFTRSLFFLLRIGGIGVVTYLLLVEASLPPIPYLAGLSTGIFCMTFIFFSRSSKRSYKEA